jgi:CubicO group peptidase (beta-lactamase class C family)
MNALPWVVRRLSALALPVALLLSGAPAPLEAQPGATSSPAAAIDRGELEAFVDATVRDAMDRDGIAGVNLAVVDASGPLLIKSYGIMAPGRPVTPDTLFPMQSISKTMVWIALMQLVEQGKIGLNDPVNRYLPTAAQIPDDGFQQPIRVRDLMSHTPGFEESQLGILFVDRPERLLPLDSWLERHRVHRVREPGRVVVYSNYGGTLGGAIVSHVTGMAWQDYAEQKIIRPLGMDATFRQPYPAALAKRLALPQPMDAGQEARLTDGFHTIGGRLVPARREYTADYPAGAMVATPKAMAAYMLALLDPERMQAAGVLKASTVLAMREPLFAGPAGFGDLRHGFGAQYIPGDAIAFGHNGDSLYTAASVTVIPSVGLGVFVSTNTPNGEELDLRLKSAIVERFFGARLPPAVYEPGAADAARSYAGEYRTLRRPYFRTEHGIYDLLIDTDTVAARANGDIEIGSLLGSTRRFVPLGAGVYRDAVGPERVAFRPLGATEGLFQPYRDVASERIGAFETPEWGLLVMLATLLGAVAAAAVAVREALRRRPTAAFERYAVWSIAGAAAAWLIGFGLFGAVLVKALTAADVKEIMWWYPPATLVLACWAFATAAALSVIATPGLAVIGRANGWPRWRRGFHAFATLVFLTCAFELWRLSFLGFSGW